MFFVDFGATSDEMNLATFNGTFQRKKLTQPFFATAKFLGIIQGELKTNV